MPSTVMQQRRFDARPDRVDYRDREYQPPLVSLPECCPDPEFLAQHLPSYTASGLILDQGQEGAGHTWKVEELRFAVLSIPVMDRHFDDGITGILDLLDHFKRDGAGG